jgi:hypothetical protein
VKRLSADDGAVPVSHRQVLAPIAQVDLMIDRAYFFFAWTNRGAVDLRQWMNATGVA